LRSDSHEFTSPDYIERDGAGGYRIKVINIIQAQKGIPFSSIENIGDSSFSLTDLGRVTESNESGTSTGNNNSVSGLASGVGNVIGGAANLVGGFVDDMAEKAKKRRKEEEERKRNEELELLRIENEYNERIERENAQRKRDEDELDKRFKEIEEESNRDAEMIRTKEFEEGKYVGQLEEGMRMRMGTMYYSNGDIYTGWWVFNRRRGKGIQKYSDGSYSEGEWSADDLNGKGVKYFADSDEKQIGTFEDGRLVGNCRIEYGRGNDEFPNSIYEGDSDKKGYRTIIYNDGTKFEFGSDAPWEPSKFDSSLFVKIGKQDFAPNNYKAKYFDNGRIIHQAKSEKEWIWFCDNSLPAWTYPNFKIVGNSDEEVIYNYYVTPFDFMKGGEFFYNYAFSSSVGKFAINQLIDAIKNDKLALISEELGGTNHLGFNANNCDSIIFNDNKCQFNKTAFTIWTTQKIDNKRTYFKFNLDDGNCEIKTASKYDGFPIRMVKISDEE